MKVSCQSCSAKYTIADEKVSGRIVKIRCKKCGATIVVNGNDMAAQTSDASTDNEVWTVSVSDEDQRSMTAAEVATAYKSGLVNDETYCWKEGMADWLPLREIDALAGAVGGARVSIAPPADEGGGDLFGLGSGGDTGASGGGLFGDAPLAAAAAAPSAARRTGGRAGGDLFSGAAAAGGEEEVMTSAPGMTPPPSGDAKLTGQRNENSVLFSLNALTSTNTGPVKNETTAQGDASGLIDIRALSTSMNKPEESSSKVDDIMNLSGGGAFNAALTAPALAPPMVVGGGMGAATPSFAPEPQQQSSNKGLMFGLIGLGAFILVAALVVVFAFKEDKDDTVAKNDTPPASASLGAGTAPTPADTAATGATGATPTPAASTAATPPNVGTATAPGSDKPIAAKSGGSKSGDKEPAAAPAPAPAPTPEKPKSLADEMAKAAGGSATQGGGGGGGSTPSAPFDKGAALAALGGVNVSSCKKDQSGNGHVKIIFAPSGSVSSATVDEGPFVGTPVGGCVAGKYRGARVPPFSGSPVTVGKSFSIN